MKKFLAFLMAALMLLSVAVAEAIPSPTAEVAVVDEPSITPAIEGTVTPELFDVDTNPVAVALAELVMDTIEAVPTPVEAYSETTQAAVLETLNVEAENVTLAVPPTPIVVNEEVAQTVEGNQVLMLSNVPVGEKFVIVLNVKIGDDVFEIVLTEVDTDPVTLQVYAKVDEATLEQLRKADLVIATVLTVN